MNLREIKYVYLLGIGGIGMSALARYFKALGMEVGGYDKTPTTLTHELDSEGIAVHYDDDINFFKSLTRDHTPERVLVIYTPAIPKDHREYLYFIKQGFSVKKRSGVLGEITKDSFTIAVAGTHGKTTTTALIAHILTSSGHHCTAFVGGIMTNYHSNLLLGKEMVIVEADEYDRSFLTLYPDIAVITSMDADHLDIYGKKENLEESFNLFAAQIKPHGTLIHKKNLPLKNPTVETFTYASTGIADFYPENIRIEDGCFCFDLRLSGNLPDHELGNGIKLLVPGRHNIENALSAIAVAKKLNIPGKKIRQALETFKGVKRRFEYIIRTKQFVFIDDYAHHPEELKACISAVKELYPDKKITGVFQPHLYSRTRDFADEFARSLELLDEVILLDIYPAREMPIEGVDSKMLMEKIRKGKKKVCSKSELVDELLKRNVAVLLTLGAGDIDALVPTISEVFRQKYFV